MGTKKGQRRKTARRAYEDIGPKNPRKRFQWYKRDRTTRAAGLDDPFREIGLGEYMMTVLTRKKWWRK